MLDAEIYYLLGVEIDPNNIRINSNLSKLYIEMNRLDEAKNRLKVLKTYKIYIGGKFPRTIMIELL